MDCDRPLEEPVLLHGGVGLVHRLRLHAMEAELDGRPFLLGEREEALDERDLGLRLRRRRLLVARERGLIDGVARVRDVRVEVALRVLRDEPVERRERSRLLRDVELLLERRLERGVDLVADRRRGGP